MQALFAEVVAAAGDVKKEIGSDLTEFEVGTAAAFLHFQHTGVEVAVVEVGLGGRLDSTNVVDAKGVAIGPISLDHVSLLGASLGSIAKEKAGIFRPGVPAVIAPQHPEAAKVIAKAAAALPTPLVWVRETAWSPGRESVADWLDSLREEPDSQGSTTVFYGVIEWGPQGGRFHLRTPRGVYRELQTPLLGLHQVQNAAVAVTLVETLRDRGFAVDEAQIREGLLSARWPGRLELVPGAPKILLDGVHNQGGAQAFARAFARIFGDARPVFVVALTGEKDPKEVLGPLAPFASHMVTTRPRSSRVPAVDPDTLAACASALGLPATSCQNAGEALERAAALAGEDGMVCVCGSLYLVGEVRGLLAPRGIPLIAGSEVIAVTRNGNHPRRNTRRGITYGWSGT